MLDRNPENYFAEVEQAALSPANIVPGVSFSPDKMLQGRLFAYADAHRYRIGANHNQLPINRPHSPVDNYQRDGQMRFDGNGGSSLNYEPNSFNGPKESPEDKDAPFEVTGMAAQTPYDRNDHYTQPGDLYRLMSEQERARLAGNIIASLSNVPEEIQLRQIEHFSKADPEYGSRVAQGLGLNIEV